MVVVQRVGEEQWLLLDSHLIAEAGVYQHHGVSHAGLFSTLDELQLRALHHDGIPEDGQRRRTQSLQQLEQLVFCVHPSPDWIVSQTEDSCNLQRTNEEKIQSTNIYIIHDLW